MSPCIPRLVNKFSDHLIGLSGKGSARNYFALILELALPGQKKAFSNIIVLPAVLQPTRGVQQSIYALAKVSPSAAISGKVHLRALQPPQQLGLSGSRPRKQSGFICLPVQV